MSTRRVTIQTAAGGIEASVAEVVTDIGLEVQSRAYRVANELENQSNMVLRGQRHGRRYKVPGTYKRQRDKVTGKMRNGVYYTASAPGEAPANRTGAFRESWHRSTRVEVRPISGKDFAVKGVIESRLTVGKGHLLGEILEDGTPTMAPRPYKQEVIDRAMPRAVRIYDAPYGRSFGP